MAKVREIDVASPIITKMDGARMKLDVPQEVDILDALKQGRIEYYKEMMEKKKPISVRFSGLRRGKNGSADELFAIFENLELIYPREKIPFKERVEATDILDKEYVVYVRGISEDNNRVYLSDERYNTRKDMVDEIEKKLRAGEDIYLRGRIIGLQRDGGKYDSMLACYVDIGGTGVLGIIPIQQWAVGYSATTLFQQMVNDNIGSIVNFKIKSKSTIRVAGRTRQVFVCSRQAYLKKIGYNPWKNAEKSLTKGATLKVRIIEEGRTKDSYFGAIDGIFDLNLLCYCDGKSDLVNSKIIPGNYYYGFVQKVDYAKHYLQVRLTKKAEYGSEIKRI